ncbi:VWA domain-containing protein, partial [Rhizobiaceae sp. 2RAB30]
MVNDDELDLLRSISAPIPDAKARAHALEAALAAYDGSENHLGAAKGSAPKPRLIERASKLWREMMQMKLIA